MRFLTILLFAACLLPAQTPAPQSAAASGGVGARPGSERTSVLILGVGSPDLTAERSGTCIGVIVHGTVYMFDAGAGVERRMFELRSRANNTIQHIGPLFITHLHSDHTLGIPGILYHVREPGKPLAIYGPPGLKNMMTHILAAWEEDRDIRVNGLEHADPARWNPTVHEAASGIVYRDEDISVKAFEVPHGNWEHALAYRIDAPGRSIVISGDTRASDAIVQACNGCDVLVHEVVWEDPAGPPGNEYMRNSHTAPAELGSVATKAKAKMVILYHQVRAWAAPGGPADFVRAVMTRYNGPVIYARDLEVY